MIAIQNLSKRFGRVTALDDISLHVAPGETFALLGPNGSGKTTALKCLAGLCTPSAGQVFINGIDPANQPVAAKAMLSYLPQRVAFPEQITAREVLDFYRRLRDVPRQRVEFCLENCALTEVADRLVSEFSGGMQQRLGIAVAVLADAPILLLDEPTASLDPEGAAALRAFLDSLKDAGKTIVFSSHLLSDVEYLADRVAILVGGRLRAVETIATLLDRVVQLNKTNKRFIQPSLEDIYLRYIHADSADRASARRRELREPAAAAG